MAQKFKSSLKQKGFKPEQISNAGVDRILQEGNRQVNVLKEQFAYERSQRDKVLSAMKENARAEKIDRTKNFNLETKNRKDIQARKDLNFQTRQDNLKNQAEAQGAIYKELAGLSKIATEKLQELAQQRANDDYDDEMARILMGEIDVVQQANFQTTEDELMVASAENEVGADALAAAGATDLQVQRVRSNSKGRQYARDKAQSILTMQQYLPWFQQQLAEDNTTELELNGEVFTPATAVTPEQKRYASVKLMPGYMKATGLYGLNPQFLTPALQATRKELNTFMATEEAAYTASLKSDNVEDAKTAFRGEVNTSNLLSLFQAETVINGGNRTKALDNLFTFAGGALTPEQLTQLGTLTFPNKKEPISEMPRFQKAVKAQQEQVRQEYRDSETDREQALKEFERQLIAALGSEGQFSQEAYELAQKRYRENRVLNPLGKESEALTQFNGRESRMAVGREQLKELILGNEAFTEEDLRNLDDRVLRNDDEIKNWAKTNSAFFNSKEIKDSRETMINKVLELKQVWDPNTGIRNPSTEDLFLISQLRNQFNRKLRAGAAAPSNGTTPISDIANAVADDLFNNFKERFESIDPEDIATDPWNENFTGDRRRYGKDIIGNAQRLQSKVDKLQATGDVKNTLRTRKGVIFGSEEQVNSFEQEYMSAGFAWPQNLTALAITLGMSPLEMVNLQREAYAQAPLPPRPSDYVLEEINPNVRAAILRANTGNQSVRALSQTGSDWNSGAIPVPSYVPFIEEAAQTYNIPPAIIAGLIEQESSWNPSAKSKYASGLTQFIPETAAAMGVNVNDPRSSIIGAAKYLRTMMDDYGWDIERALYAYNAGPGGGVGLSRENREYTPGVLKKAAKYGYRQSWQSPATMRPGMAPKVIYIAGDIGSGAAYTGQHTDVKRTDGQQFNPTDLDQYVEVEDREKGRVPLSQVGITGDWSSHTRRGSHGIDYGTIAGDKIYLKNGAEYVLGRDSGDGNGDVVVIRTPEGIEYQFLHGTMPN